MIILDADILSQLQRNNPRVLEKIEDSEEEIFITLITKLEMLKGRIDYILKASTKEDILRAQALFVQTGVLLSQLPLLFFDNNSLSILQRLSEVKAYQKLGRADLLIARITLANKATLITRNTKDFSKISQLKLANWID